MFLLVTALGQKSLGGASAGEVLESILSLLAKLLAPLLSSNVHGYMHNSGKFHVKPGQFIFVQIVILKLSGICTLNILSEDDVLSIIFQ